MIANAPSGELDRRLPQTHLIVAGLAAAVLLAGCREPLAPRQPFHEPGVVASTGEEVEERDRIFGPGGRLTASPTRSVPGGKP